MVQKSLTRFLGSAELAAEVRAIADRFLAALVQAAGLMLATLEKHAVDQLVELQPNLGQVIGQILAVAHLQHTPKLSTIMILYCTSTSI